MTVTTAYSFSTVSAAAGVHGSGFVNVDFAGLAGGGYASTGLYTYGSPHNDIFMFNSDGAYAGAVYHSMYSDLTATTGLTNGNAATVGLSSTTDIAFSVNTPSAGGVITGTLGFVGTVNHISLENPDVAGLTSGDFATAFDNQFNAGDHDIYVITRHADGGAGTQISVDFSSNDDTAPSVAALSGGGFAVAWIRTSGGATSIMRAVYDGSNSSVLASTLTDGSGTVNQNVSVVGLADGGFGIAYEDSEWGAHTHITFQRFDSAGVFVSKTDITSADSVNDTDPYATLLSNGYVAVTYSHATNNGDILTEVFDPTSPGTILGTLNSASTAGTESHAVNAGGHGGEFVVSWEDSAAEFEVRGFVRTTTGDNNANTLTGDDIIDVMNGGKKGDHLNGLGGDDTLNGSSGNDTLKGGAGADTLNGGVGTDTATYADASVGVQAGLGGGAGTGDALGDTFVSVENLTGSAFVDFLTGDNHNNVLDGGGGADQLFGGAGKDTMKGGNGADYLEGGGGRDHLIGGPDADTFGYFYGGDSNGPNYDTITGFNANVDGFVLGIAISAVDPAVNGGTLNQATFNSDMVATIGNGQLGKDHAVLYTPDAGDLAGHTFLIIDGNSKAGYQTNKEFVIYLEDGLHLNNLSPGSFGTLAPAPPPDIGPMLELLADHPAMAAPHGPAMDLLSAHSGLHLDHYGIGHFLV